MKTLLVEKIRAEVRQRLERLMNAALEAHAAATDPGSKAENKYDTRNLEASYLASGQARKAEELAEAARLFNQMTLPDFAPDAPIAAGALVEVTIRAEVSFFLLVPLSGGLEIVHEGREITLLSPASDLYQKLVGRRAGESLSVPPMAITAVS